MDIKIHRLNNDGESTIGLAYIDNKMFCSTLEDTTHEIKVPGETRIPAGKYKVTFREVVTPLTEKYRERFPWFTYHLWIRDVPKFQYIYIHAGNTISHTAGCLLVGDQIILDRHGPEKIASSYKAFEAFYKKVSAAIKKGEDVFIDYIDELW